MAVSSTEHNRKSQRWFQPVLSSWLSSKLTLPRCRTPAMMAYIASLSSSDRPMCVMASSVSLKSAMSSIWMSFRLPLCTNYERNKQNCGKALSSATQSTNQNLTACIITHFTAENAILHLSLDGTRELRKCRLPSSQIQSRRRVRIWVQIRTLDSEDFQNLVETSLSQRYIYDNITFSRIFWDMSEVVEKFRI